MKLAILAASLVAVSFVTAAALHAGPEQNAQVERGRYLVHSVAMCVQCHSPRDGQGDLIPTQHLHGNTVPFPTPYKDMRWAVRAPHIAGLPGYSDEQALRLLTEGITANSGVPKMPMPPFRMSKDDAQAVIAYLRSID